MNWPDAIYRIFHEGWGYLVGLSFIWGIVWILKSLKG